MRRARQYVQEGRRWVVDIDLEKFFDRVNHDILMGRLAKRIEDRRVLVLIRRYLEAGVLAEGVVMEREEGTPQGGPSHRSSRTHYWTKWTRSWRRGHAFARYGDDLNVYVRTQRAGERVMRSMRRLYARLRLQVNEAKSAVALARERKFLSFSFWTSPEREVKWRVAPQALGRMKGRVRELTRRTIGRSLVAVCKELRKYLLGWKEYVRLAQTPKIFQAWTGGSVIGSEPCN